MLFQLSSYCPVASDSVELRCVRQLRFVLCHEAFARWDLAVPFPRRKCQCTGPTHGFQFGSEDKDFGSCPVSGSESALALFG